MASATSSAGPPLTVVLVHGAFADASGWSGVIDRLLARGLRVIAPANPLRGISIDSAYVAGVLGSIPGPVLAVGHSYGGAVTNAAATYAENVVGLVYVAGFAPDEGERLIDAESVSKDSILNSALVPLQYPIGQGPETAVEFVIDPAKFRDAFAADLPAEQTARDGCYSAPGSRARVLRALRHAGMEEPPLLDCGRNRRHGGRRRRHPFYGRTRRGQ